MRHREPFDPRDLRAIGQIAWRKDFTIRDLADKRSPHLNYRSAALVVKRFAYQGGLRKVKRGVFTPTEQGWREIEAVWR